MEKARLSFICLHCPNRWISIEATVGFNPLGQKVTFSIHRRDVTALADRGEQNILLLTLE